MTKHEIAVYANLFDLPTHEKEMLGYKCQTKLGLVELLFSDST